MAIHVFGLTGGIATGKSTVAARWQQRRLPVVDADELARQVVAPGSAGLAALLQLMGNDVLRADGSLDRARVASRAFSNAQLRLALEAILHPRIQEALDCRIRALEQQDETLACYEASLLVEVGRADFYRPLVVVVAEQSAQLQRALARNGQRGSEVRSRISSQAPMSQKAAAADIVITNDGTLDELQMKADATLAQVCSKLNLDPSRYEIV
jgi:dephospho-CoA kinase